MAHSRNISIFSDAKNAFINKIHFAGFIEFPLLISYAILHSLLRSDGTWIEDQETAPALNI